MKPVIWLLGLSGSGKTTLGSLLRLFLESQGEDVAFIDENIFRARQEGMLGDAELEEALREHVLECQAQGRVCIVCAVSASAESRRRNRAQLPFYHEIWVRCSLDTLVRRDPRGLYARAEAGETICIPGLSHCFDEPLTAHAVIDTDCDLTESYMNLRCAALEILERNSDWQELRRELALGSGPAMPMPDLSGCRIQGS